MKKITLADFEKNRAKKTEPWLGWLSLCILFLLSFNATTYGQGQTCLNPFAITTLPFAHNGNTSNFGNDYIPSNVPAVATGAVVNGTGSTSYMTGFEVVYSITPIINGQITITTTNDDGWMALWAFSGCPFSSTVGYHTSTSGTSRAINNLPVVANTTYYLVFSSWDPPGVNYTINVTGTEGLLQPLAACTGMPSGGTASLTPSGGNAGATFVAKATGVTLASGLGYQWQKNIGGTWQDIAGATTINSSIVAEAGAVGATTDYRLKVTCTALDLTAYSTTTTYTISLVYCTSVPTSKDGSGITNVALGTSNFAVPNQTYYSHPTAMNLIAGITNQASVTFATGYTYHTNIWIDLNNNGTFEASELLFQGESTNANPTTFNTSFYLDAGVSVGLRKMRIGTADSGQATPNPCYNLSYGVTVDVMVNILPPPTCLPPSALTASNITSTSADLSWTSAGTVFDIQWGPQGFALESGTPVNGVNKPYALTPLTPNTKYSYYVRQDCGAADGVSIWSGPYTFTTACGLLTSFTEKFDTYTSTGPTNPLPTCWTRFGNTGSSYITTGSTAPMSPGNKLYLSGANTGATNGVAVMPSVSNLQAQTHRLRFMAYANSAEKSLEIGYYDSSDDATSFVVLEEFEMPSTAQSSATEFIYEPQLIPAGITSLAFRANGGAFPGTTVIYIDNIFWEPLPLCFDITTVLFPNITATNVDVEWTNGGSETAWEYVFGPSATTTSPTTQGLVPTLVTNTPYTSITTNIASSTTYNFWIRSVCPGNVKGNWSAVKTFTTPCAAAALPWVEGFEAVATVGTTAFPPCWFKEVGNWSTALASAYNTPKSGTKYLRAHWNATNSTMWTPGFELTAGTSYDFSYFMQGDGALGWTVDLMQNNAQVATSATQVGDTAIPNGSGPLAIQQYQYVKNTFTVPADGVYYFALRVNQPSSVPYYVAFDDMRLEITPTCIAPTIANATNVTSSIATVSWSAPAAPISYEYFITSDIATAPTAATVPTGTVAGTVNQINVALPSPSTVYNFYVRAICSASDKSSWSAATTITSSCAEVAAFEEHFDTSATGSTNPLPLCWIRAGNGSTYVTSGGALPGTAPNRLYMFASGTATPPSQAVAIMPKVSNLQANTHRLQFKAYASATGKYIELGYYTDVTDLTTFVLLETFNLPATAATTAQTFTYNPINIPTGINALAFRNPATQTASTTAYIDDVTWLPKPTVVPACATNVVAVPNATCGNYATAITWSASATADGYYLNLVSTVNGVEETQNLNVGLVTTYSFLGTPGRTYNASVVAYNSAGSATGCSTLSFTTVAAGCYCPSVPTSNDNSGITNVLVGNQNFANGDVMYFDHTATPVDLAQGVLSNLKITFATGYTYNTHVWIDFNNNFNFEADELVYTGESTNSNPTVLNASFLMPANAAMGMHRMRIGSADSGQVLPNPCYSGSFGVTLDFKINVTAAPTCLAPLGLSVDPNSITTTTAGISWIASTTPATGGYEYYHSTSSSAPTAATVASGSVPAGSTSAVVSGLPSSSVQYVYVRAICSTTDTSAWSQPITFTTLCDATTLPYTIDFEAVTVPNLPICTSNQNVGTGNNWLTAAAPSGSGFSGKVLKYTYNGTNAANTWFYTNRFNLVAGTQYSVSYKYGTTSTTWTESLRVSYGTMANSTAMTTELADHPIINTNATLNNSATFTPTVSGTYVIGFQAYSIANQLSLYVDDIVIQEVLGTKDFDSNAFTAYPNPVKNNLTIRYNENITDATVYNVMGQQLLTKKINATEGQIDMSSFASGTYLIKVTSGDKVQTMKVIKE